jgi:hypothetical protein
MISMTRRNVCAKPEMNDEVGIVTLLNATYVTYPYLCPDSLANPTSY